MRKPDPGLHGVAGIWKIASAVSDGDIVANAQLHPSPMEAPVNLEE
jgi:hypothetical protein